jgi:hypothetical protein
MIFKNQAHVPNILFDSLFLLNARKVKVALSSANALSNYDVLTSFQ